MFSVSLAVPSQIYPIVKPGIEMISIERKLRQVDDDQMRLQPSQPMPERDDDWFVLFDTVREEAVTLPSGIQLSYVCTSSVVTSFAAFRVKHLFGGYAGVAQIV